MRLKGYVNFTGTHSRVLHKSNGEAFTEIIAPGTFKRALAKQPCNEVRFNHNQVLDCFMHALFEDETGLYADVEVNKSQFETLAQNNRLTGWSFSFTCNRDMWATKDGVSYRTVYDLTLHEISILTVTPAYFHTDIEARSDVELRANNNEVSIDNAQYIEQLNTYKQHIDFLMARYT